MKVYVYFNNTDRELITRKIWSFPGQIGITPFIENDVKVIPFLRIIPKSQVCKNILESLNYTEYMH